MVLSDQQKLQKIQILEQKKKMHEELPHKFAFRDYKWSRDFLNSRNRLCFLTAANQIGKSTIQLRKMITLATEPSEWPSIWVRRPRQFWLAYPSKDVASLEYETKIKYLLPQGSMKESQQYGWEAIFDNRKFAGIRFNSGIYLAVKTYAQNPETLQSGTCDYVGLDEEPPAELMPELFMRLSASNGMLSAVFTATSGQEYFRLVMEERGTPYEKLPQAEKFQVSMYDCLTYADGTPSSWTPERIEEIKARCGSEAEIQMRVYGRFVVSEGRIFSEFSIKDNVKHGGAIPTSWLLYAGIDYGSGGERNHPCGIAFVAVKPDFTEARLVRAYRGDGVQTDASAIVMRYLAMKNELKSLGLNLICVRYDQSCRDLLTIASRMGEAFQAAEKSHDTGVPILNALFKNRILFIDEEQEECMKAAYEFSSLLTSTPKTRARDDLADAVRYATSLIPFNWTILNSKDRIPDTHVEPEKPESENDQRRAWLREAPKPEDYLEEFDEWNENYEG